MKKFLKFIIILIMLLEARFFYILPLPSGIEKFNSYNNKFLITVIIIFSIFTLCIINNLKIYINSIFNKFIAAIIILWIIEFFISYIKYNQSISDIILAGYHFFIILFYYILKQYVQNDDDYYWMINLITKVSVILSIMFILQSIFYSLNGSLLLNIYEFKSANAIQTRYGVIRMTQPSTIISFSIVISFAIIMKKNNIKNFILHMANIILGVIYIYSVCQTRILLLVIIITMFITAVMVSNKRIILKILQLIAICVVILFVINLDLTKEFINSFSDVSQSGSVYARTEAVEHYLNIFKNNPILGMGFINPVENTEFFYYIRGIQGYLYTTDVGIIGFIATLGIAGFLWLVILIFKMVAITFNRKAKIKANNIQSIAVITYLICTLPTLIITDPQRIILLPFMFIILEYNYYNKNIKFPLRIT